MLSKLQRSTLCWHAPEHAWQAMHRASTRGVRHRSFPHRLHTSKAPGRVSSSAWAHRAHGLQVSTPQLGPASMKRHAQEGGCHGSSAVDSNGPRLGLHPKLRRVNGMPVGAQCTASKRGQNEDPASDAACKGERAEKGVRCNKGRHTACKAGVHVGEGAGVCVCAPCPWRPCG